MAGENRSRLLWTKRQPCCAPGAPSGCKGPVEAHHAGRHGVGQKAHDDTAIPLCMGHHRAWHDNRGPFDWLNGKRRAWADQLIAETQARWDTAA